MDEKIHARAISKDIIDVRVMPLDSVAPQYLLFFMDALNIGTQIDNAR